MGDELAHRVGTWTVRRFDTIDSTNRWLLDEARSGAAAGLVAVADEQTDGRGRRGRAWIAPRRSSLLVSVLLRPELEATRIQVVTMATAIALAEAVERVSGVRAGIKWPNDLVVGDRKLAGILTETDVDADGAVRAVVVGVGCNVEWPAFPSELEGVATACNIEAGSAVDRDAVLAEFLAQLTVRLSDLGAVPAISRARMVTLGCRVRVDLGSGRIVGTAVDVDDLGRLLVETDAGEQETITAGDVEHLRDESERDQGFGAVERPEATPGTPASSERDRG